MQKLFNKILVPVDFTAKSKSVLEKAADIAKQYNCSIHLLHVVTVSPFAAVAVGYGNVSLPRSIGENIKELEFRLSKLAKGLSLLNNEKLTISYSTLTGTWDQVIIDLIKQEKFDLVLIGQKGRLTGKRKMLLNPDAIAEKANVPVITVPSNRRLVRLYSVVIPITDFLPIRKLMYGIYISSTYNTTIKLLGIENRKTKSNVKLYLKKSYQLIHDNSTISVEQDIIYSENIAEAINDYALQQSADLVIVNPGTQTKMPGLLSSILGKILQKYSAPPVLAINTV